MLQTQFELYIGNLPDGAREEELLMFLNQEMIAKGLSKGLGNAFTQVSACCSCLLAALDSPSVAEQSSRQICIC